MQMKPSRDKDTTVNNERLTLHCKYCNKLIADGNYLTCIVCDGNVHIKCLEHASTPGDLLGDVFFDFTCIKCARSAATDKPSSSAAAREKFVRRRMPWMLVIVMAIYNLSIKSKGLSHHGYFHWRTHIISFIDKNWDYIFEPNTRRRKQWIGSVSGALSHNNPKYFLSGQEVFNEHGWWKLAHSNQTPRYIFGLYEKQSQKRQNARKDRPLPDENSCGSGDLSPNDAPASKRAKQSDSPEEPLAGGCSRTIPYMGRKPKVAKQLNIIDDDILNRQQQQPLNTVQSSLMDFLAESLGGDDLSVFNNLPSIAAEPLIDDGRNDFLMSSNLLDTPTDSGHYFDLPNTKSDVASNDFSLIPNEPVDAELRSLYAEQQSEPLSSVDFNDQQQYKRITENIKTYDDDNAESEHDDDEDDELYQPRIVQVTNFQQTDQTTSPQQQLTTPAASQPPPNIKTELQSEEEAELNNAVSETQEPTIFKAPLPPCKPSLFEKRMRRNWPWLMELSTAEELDSAEELQATPKTKIETTGSEDLTLMSLYEEQQLHQKMERVFALENQCQIKIPAHVRRFYRKLCIRKWKREHNRPIFDLDDYSAPNGKERSERKHESSQILDRYQLISLSTKDARKSFYARIAGSSEHELFESPYTQRILHPFIYRSKATTPPWLKLMCELKEKVTGTKHPRAPIDYCYVRPCHIAAVNALLQTAFWPGIDMSECLSYPDYSVVALYKKLVVGCGFLVPDVGYNEAYISFMAVRPAWQRSGIATFMLYHLIQTCMTKDITLHVSATNPAVMLYQKFGFKIEEVILDFYEKYLGIDARHSRHAFLLRLMR